MYSNLLEALPRLKFKKKIISHHVRTCNM